MDLSDWDYRTGSDDAQDGRPADPKGNADYQRGYKAGAKLRAQSAKAHKKLATPFKPSKWI